MNDTSEVTYTQYAYTSTGDLEYTLSGETKSDVTSAIATLSTLGSIATLDSAAILTVLTSGMSIAIYDQDAERVASVWSRSGDGTLTYTGYIYEDVSGKLIATVSGEEKATVDAVITSLATEDITALLNADIDALLDSGMSVAIYDTVNNRVDAVWSKSEEGTVTYTMYAYTGEGTLGYTVTGEDKSQVEGFRGVSVNYIASLSETQVAAYLSNGMSIAVYDTTENRVAYVWSKGDTGAVTFTMYAYNSTGELSYTVSGDTRSSVESAASSLSGLDITTITADSVDTLLSIGMSIAVYDTTSEQIDYVWSKSETNDVTVTQYAYTSEGDIAYTVTANTRSEITAFLTALGTQDITTLSNAEVTNYLTAEMSIALYDATENRVASVWSKSTDGDVSFTGYVYNSDGDLAVTVTGTEQTDVLSVITNLNVATLTALTTSDIETLLNNEMSIAIYDTENNRVAAVWSKSIDADVTYTMYGYSTNGTLSFTVSGEEKTDVETLMTSLAGYNVRTLSENAIDTLLAAGMSIAVYDTAGSLIDHVWSRSESGEATYTKYAYNSDNELIYTVSGSTRTAVNTAALNLASEPDITTLDNAYFTTLLSSGMSVAIYDTADERVSSVWSKSAEGVVTYTGYVYNSTGDLAVTVTGDNQTSVAAVIGALTLATINTLETSDITTLLSSGMSVAIYDTASERIESIWSMNDTSEVTYTQYAYTSTGDLEYTLSGETKSDVTSAIAT
ncbi:MAG: hypothetical protein GY849_04195, partial [Deltaproteobacteria bacterium]|nr:hypothetical protein [Deltaproteobacteria bacterium]